MNELMEQVNGNLEWLESIAKAFDGDATELIEGGYGDSESDPVELAYEALEGGVLSIDTRVVKRVWLTLGGPNIFVDCTMVDGEVDSMSLEGYWGGESRQMSIQPSDPAWDVVARLVEVG